MTLNQNWTPEDDRRARGMLADGADMAIVAAALGRSRGAVKSRLRYLSLSPERRRAETKAHHASRKPVERKTARQRVTPSHVEFVPPGALEAAQSRLAAPRSLTAIVCGDPAPGQSALDRRRSEASV